MDVRSHQYIDLCPRTIDVPCTTVESSFKENVLQLVYLAGNDSSRSVAAY